VDERKPHNESKFITTNIYKVHGVIHHTEHIMETYGTKIIQ